MLVASRGDEELVKLYGRRAWHFPRLANGTYLGHHPANSEAAIVHLQTMRALGATHFVLPEPSRWWLDHYAELSLYLETRCRVLFRNDDICRIYSLVDRPARRRNRRNRRARGARRRVPTPRFDRDPMILNWDTGRELGRAPPGAAGLRSGRVRSATTPTTSTTSTTSTTRSTSSPWRRRPARVRRSRTGRVRRGRRLEESRRARRVTAYGGPAPAGGRVRLDAASSLLPSLSIVVPCYDGLDHTRVCLDTLARVITPGPGV